uniref:Uncharacterized protein n=1 Tax=viral metagenome TaxID=1070528 RepID=A0A6H1ZSC1_9ZZZZ
MQNYRGFSLETVYEVLSAQGVKLGKRNLERSVDFIYKAVDGTANVKELEFVNRYFGKAIFNSHILEKVGTSVADVTLADNMGVTLSELYTLRKSESLGYPAKRRRRRRRRRKVRKKKPTYPWNVFRGTIFSGIPILEGIGKALAGALNFILLLVIGGLILVFLPKIVTFVSTTASSIAGGYASVKSAFAKARVAGAESQLADIKVQEAQKRLGGD